MKGCPNHVERKVGSCHASKRVATDRAWWCGRTAGCLRCTCAIGRSNPGERTETSASCDVCAGSGSTVTRSVRCGQALGRSCSGPVRSPSRSSQASRGNRTCHRGSFHGGHTR